MNHRSNWNTNYENKLNEIFGMIQPQDNSEQEMADFLYTEVLGIIGNMQDDIKQLEEDNEKLYEELHDLATILQDAEEKISELEQREKEELYWSSYNYYNCKRSKESLQDSKRNRARNSKAIKYE